MLSELLEYGQTMFSAHSDEYRACLGVCPEMNLRYRSENIATSQRNLNHHDSGNQDCL